jgi:exopolyphosphatase/guanosine-5'-triphosphate,3'-diphosphate pyrophosphatase
VSTPRRQAIIDVGSNSIRLVVFGGAPRAPVVLYNEKVMAGLGRGVVSGGRLDPAAVEVAIAGLARFAALLGGMDLTSVDVVATAAVREASDGADFLARVRALGLQVRVLAGDEEAVGAGYGVISGLPAADGVVGDMGGGSLELVRVSAGEVHGRASFPLGALRIAALRAAGPSRHARAVRSAVRSLGWREEARGRPLYLVGGAWRTLARIHMQMVGFPLPVIANYAIPLADIARLRRSLAASQPAALAAIRGVKASRVPQLGDAAALLDSLATELRPSECVVSAFGLREGLLYGPLPQAERTRDPLIEGVRFLTAGQQQVEGYAEALDAWLDQVFGDETVELRRLRTAVCLLRGTGWTSNPDFRALSGEELALHGNWSGVDAAGRAAMAMALFVGMGGDGSGAPAILGQLAAPDLLARARAWGQAIRLAQRIGGGAPGLLAKTRLHTSDDALVVTLPPGQAKLVDTVLERRAARLAVSLGLRGAIVGA